MEIFTHKIVFFNKSQMNDYKCFFMLNCVIFVLHLQNMKSFPNHKSCYQHLFKYYPVFNDDGISKVFSLFFLPSFFGVAFVVVWSLKDLYIVSMPNRHFATPIPPLKPPQKAYTHIQNIKTPSRRFLWGTAKKRYMHLR